MVQLDLKVHRSFKMATCVAGDWAFIHFFISHAGLSGGTGPSPDNLYLTAVAQICPAPAVEWGTLGTCSA